MLPKAQYSWTCWVEVRSESKMLRSGYTRCVQNLLSPRSESTRCVQNPKPTAPEASIRERSSRARGYGGARAPPKVNLKPKPHGKMDCNICMDTCTDAWKCVCGASTCKSCFATYISFQSKVAVCVGTNCKELINPMKLDGWLEAGCVAMYKTAALRYITALYSADSGVTLEDLGLNNDDLIERTRLRYLESFPLCIRLTIRQVMMDKVPASDKAVFEKIETVDKCLLKTCKGLLEESVCNICGLVKCEECGDECKSGAVHKCDPATLESYKYIQGLVKCPRCAVSIEKSSGCNYLTCAVCATRFEMTTGRIGDHGGHTVPVKKVRDKPLSTELGEFYEAGLIKDIKKLEVSVSGSKIDDLKRDLSRELIKAEDGSEDPVFNLFFKLHILEKNAEKLREIERSHLNGELKATS